MDGNERKERGGGEDKGGGSIARHDGSCWGFREPDKEGHLYLARRDRCSTIIDLRDGSTKKERTRERERGGEGRERRKRKRRGQSFNKELRELGLTVLNTWIGVPDRVIERALFSTYTVSHANAAQEETST